MKTIYRVVWLCLIISTLTAQEKRSNAEQQLEQRHTKCPRISHTPAHEKSALELLPVDAQGIILNFLVTAQGETDDEKLHHAAQSIRNFMMLNTSFTKFLRNERINGYLIRELAARYAGGNPIKAAAALHTAAGGRWLFKSLGYEDEALLIRTFVEAAGHGDLRLISFMLKHIPPIFYINEKANGDTALIAASKRRQAAIMQRLLQVPEIKVNIQDDQTRSTGLMHALDSLEFGPTNNAIIDRLLASPDVDINVRDNQRNTALIIAAWNGYVYAVDRLLGMPNIDRNAQNIEGATALVMALSTRNYTTAIRLLEDPYIAIDIPDQNGATAESLAEQMEPGPEKDRIMQLMNEGGAQ